MLHYKPYLLLAVCAFMLLTCSGTGTGPEIKTNFEYRDVFLPENTGLEPCLLSQETKTLNRVDNEWGIWGHNMEKLLGGNLPDDCYSQNAKGEIDKKQFCFSSTTLYNKVREWIIDNYGKEDTTRFAIFPKDNKICCNCKECRKKGNTETNATPAVTDFITRLCTEFPNHIFFTSYYHSTSALPRKKLPENAGVIISAITWTLKNEHTPKETAFKDMLNEWKNYTDRIYVWEYINNYEDYFTPFPCIALMQQRIQYYAKAGVKGLFFNGSGYDYSSFSDLKVYALAELMQYPNRDWEEIIREFFTLYYPESLDLLTEFCVSIERNSMLRRKYMNPYAAVDEAISEYLNVHQFLKFYKELGKLSKTVKGDEGKHLRDLYAACTLTRLEIAKIKGEQMEVPDELKNHAPSEVYSEDGWKVQDYIDAYGKKKQ